MQSTYSIDRLHTNFQISATLSKKVLIFSQNDHGQIQVGILYTVSCVEFNRQLSPPEKVYTILKSLDHQAFQKNFEKIFGHKKKFSNLKKMKM